MASSESLKLRLRLIAKFEQLAARLEAGDETAMEEAQDSLIGISMAENVETMAIVFRALVQTLDNMQREIDADGFRYVSYEGHEPPNA